MICEHAEIFPEPCEGTVYSRQIKCKAGQNNTCLRNCNEKCPAYKAYVKPKSSGSYRPVSGVSRPVLGAAPNYGSSISAMQTAQNMNRSLNPSAHKSGGCGTCGGKR